MSLVRATFEFLAGKGDTGCGAAYISHTVFIWLEKCNNVLNSNLSLACLANVVDRPANVSPCGGLPVSFSNLFSWSGLRAPSASDIVSPVTIQSWRMSHQIKTTSAKVLIKHYKPFLSSISWEPFTNFIPPADRYLTNQGTCYEDVASSQIGRDHACQSPRTTVCIVLRNAKSIFLLENVLYCIVLTVSPKMVHVVQEKVQVLHYEPLTLANPWQKLLKISWIYLKIGCPIF